MAGSPGRPAGRHESCPLCSRSQIDEHQPMKGWKTFQNSETPFPYHRLLIPSECWDEERLRRLDSPEMLAKILKMAMDEVLRTRGALAPTWIYTHIGYGSGQNIGHLHWHLCEAPSEPKPFEVKNGGRVHLMSSAYSNFRADLCGVRAGQAVMQASPTHGGLYLEQLHNTKKGWLSELASMAHKVVELFNDGFCDPSSGLGPDYCLFLGLNGEYDWHVRYTPILNNWGGSEFAALDYGTPFVLPWPHESTRLRLMQGGEDAK